MYYIIMYMLIPVGIIYGGFFLLFIFAYGLAAWSDRLRRSFDAKRTGDWWWNGKYAARRDIIHYFGIAFVCLSLLIWIPFFGAIAYLVL